MNAAQDQNGNPAGFPILLDGPAEIEAADLGHPQIEHHQVDGLAVQQFERFGGLAGFEDAIALILQDSPNDAAIDGTGIDQQNGGLVVIHQDIGEPEIPGARVKPLRKLSDCVLWFGHAGLHLADRPGGD